MSVEGLEVFNNLIGSSVDDFDYLLELLQEQKVFSQRYENEIASHINNLLGQHVTRTKGLLLLSATLDGSSGQFLLDKASILLQLCTAALKSPAEQSLAYKVIKQFLERLSLIHELERSSVNLYLPDLVQSLSNCSPQASLSALQMLETLLRKYSKSCGPHKSSIEKFLIPFVDSHEQRLVIYAAKCAHLLQQIRGGGEQGTNHKLAWASQYNLILRCLIKALSTLYSNSKNNEDEEENSIVSSNIGPLQTYLEELDNLTNLSNVPEQCNPITMRAFKISTRLQNLFIFLQAMIVDPFPVSKKMNIRAILDILMKCLTAVCGTPCGSKTEPWLHRSVMDTLRALCVSLGGNILPYFSLMLRMIVQTLEWSKVEEEESNCSNQIKPYIKVRKAAYNSLSSLLKCTRGCKPPVLRGDLNIEDTLIENILMDMCPKSTAVQLSMTNVGGPKPMNKKERRRNAMAVNAQGLPENVGQLSKNINWNLKNLELNMASMDCLQAVYVCMGNFLKPNSHKVVQESVVGLLYNKETPLEVKKNLSSVLTLMVNCSNSSQPTVLAHCIYLNSVMQHEINPELSWMSQCALQSHLSSIRGYVPPLQFPTSSTSTAATFNNSFANTTNDKTIAPSDRDDVIEVGVIDSSSDGSQDVIPDSQVTSSKKRKRSANDSIREKSQPTNNQSILIKSPSEKRSKFVINPNESVEISDSSCSEKEDVTEIEICNGETKKDSDKTDNIEDACKVLEEEHSPADKINETNSNQGNTKDESCQDICLEIVNDTTDESRAEKQDTANIAEKAPEASEPGVPKKITVEEMMEAFIDDVNEDILK